MKKAVWLKASVISSLLMVFAFTFAPIRAQAYFGFPYSSIPYGGLPYGGYGLAYNAPGYSYSGYPYYGYGYGIGSGVLGGYGGVLGGYGGGLGGYGGVLGGYGGGLGGYGGVLGGYGGGLGGYGGILGGYGGVLGGYGGGLGGYGGVLGGYGGLPGTPYVTSPPPDFSGYTWTSPTEAHYDLPDGTSSTVFVDYAAGGEWQSPYYQQNYTPVSPYDQYNDPGFWDLLRSPPP